MRCVTILQVKASVITIEADEVQKGIVDLVVRHAIKKLVIGSIPMYAIHTLLSFFQFTF